MNTIYFDLDGTLCDFYGVDNWLDYLENEDTTPYAIARPLFNFSVFARLLHKLQENGYRIGIVSWLSKCGSTAYNTAVTTVKLAWLEKHLPSVEWDEVKIVNYGTPKVQLLIVTVGFLMMKNATEKSGAKTVLM